MPPKAMTLEMIESERNNILNCALEMIDEFGFESVTMRNVAKKLNFSATKIYKYFHNKDEIFIAISIESFKLISSQVQISIDKAKDTTEQLKNLIEAIIEFAINYKHNYEIIFGSNATNYRAYLNTELDAIAKEKHRVGLEFLNIVSKVIEDFVNANDFKNTYSTNTLSLNLLSLLHGSITFYHNKLLFEFYEDTDEFKELLIHRTVNRFNEVIM